jgi:large subunit ribosomal protein L13
MPKAAEIQREWYVVDAAGKTLGRLATRIATILRGKHKPGYTPHLDMGDYVIVVNAEKVMLTGRKRQQKVYYRHSGYMGGLKEISFERMLAEFPERVIRLAVRGMLPHNSLGRRMLKKLKVYAGPDHPHQAQQPESLEL